MNETFNKLQKLQGVLLALNQFPELNKIEHGELIKEAIECYVASLEDQLKVEAGNLELSK